MLQQLPARGTGGEEIQEPFGLPDKLQLKNGVFGSQLPEGCAKARLLHKNKAAANKAAKGRYMWKLGKGIFKRLPKLIKKRAWKQTK